MQEPNYKNTARKQLYKKKAPYKIYHFVFGTFSRTGHASKFIKRSITERLAL